MEIIATQEQQDNMILKMGKNLERERILKLIDKMINPYKKMYCKTCCLKKKLKEKCENVNNLALSACYARSLKILKQKIEEK